VTSLALCKSDDCIFSGSKDKTIKMWNVKNASLICTYDEHGGSITCLEVSENDQYLISGSEDATVKIFQIKTSSVTKF